MKYFSSKKINRPSRNGGQAILIVVIMCTSIFLTIVLGVVDPIMNELRLSNDLLSLKANLYVAESSAEDAVFRVKNNMISDYLTPISIDVGNYDVTTSVPCDTGIKTIDATGNNNSNFRKIEARIVSGTGINFPYAVQAGSGGFSLTGSSEINGDVFSNGPVYANGGVTITGTVVVANSSTISSVSGGNYIGAIRVGANGVGDIWAHNVTGAQVEGTIYCQTGDFNNKSCNTTRLDPPTQNFSITDANIQSWKDYAAAHIIHNGDYHVSSSSATIGSMKITGNLLVDSNSVLTLTGTVWVQGNVVFASSSTLRLDPEYGSSGGVLVSDGTISLTQGVNFSGSGMPSSYTLLITTSSSDNAIKVTGGSGVPVLVAQAGTITLSGGTNAEALVANRIVVDSGANVAYDSGLLNFNFSNGPSNTWNISSWKEVQ